MSNKRKAKNKIVLYFLAALYITTILILVKKSDIFEVLTNRSSLRNLIDKSKRNYMCDKAHYELTDKYKYDFEEEDFKVEKISEAQQSIINFARDSKYSNIKPYLKYCGFFISLICLAILLIFYWITYCICACKSWCLFSTSSSSDCKIYLFLITIGCLSTIIILSIFNLANITYFYSKLNGSSCSIHYFFDHVIDGLSQDYSIRSNKWPGIDGLLDILNSTSYEKDKIEYDTNELSKEISENSVYLGKFEEIYETLQNNVVKTKDLIKESFDNITKGGIGNIYDINDDFGKVNEDIEEELYKVLHDHTNKYAKKICHAIFFVILFSSISGLIVLYLYSCRELTIMGKIYIVFWNIFMLMTILSFLFSAFFGIIGHLLKDFANISHYILSKENLESSDPLLFKSNNKIIINLIETCANGDGNFFNVIDGGTNVNTSIEIWKNNKKEYLKEKGNIDGDNYGRNEKLKQYYAELIDIADRSLKLCYNITNVTCRYMKNDKNIFMNEIQTAGKESINISIFSFFIGTILGISVVSGILLVHKYKLGKHTEQGIVVNNNSTSNIQNDISANS